MRDIDAKKPHITMVIATRNMGKMREFKRLFSELAPSVCWVLTDGVTAGLDEVEETGDTFMDNARLKAISGAKKTGGWCFGEDSGLSVDQLGGAPGIKAHRFSITGTDEDNNMLLLDLLSGVPLWKRTARYTSAVCVACPDGIVAEAQGTVEGIITISPEGTNGFGYDPLFYSIELKKTFGLASDSEKDGVSHRRRAVESLLRVLPPLSGEEVDFCK